MTLREPIIQLQLNHLTPDFGHIVMLIFSYHLTTDKIFSLNFSVFILIIRGRIWFHHSIQSLGRKHNRSASTLVSMPQFPISAGAHRSERVVNHSEFLEYSNIKKVFEGFDNIFHVYLMREFQKYGRNWIITVAF